MHMRSWWAHSRKTKNKKKHGTPYLFTQKSLYLFCFPADSAMTAFCWVTHTPHPQNVWNRPHGIQLCNSTIQRPGGHWIWEHTLKWQMGKPSSSSALFRTVPYNKDQFRIEMLFHYQDQEVILSSESDLKIVIILLLIF